jgi:porphobilinogen deaminase
VALAVLGETSRACLAGHGVDDANATIYSPQGAASDSEHLLRAMVATPDGQRVASAEASGPADAPEALGQQVADLLAQQDAHAILAACKAQADAADA